MPGQGQCVMHCRIGARKYPHGSMKGAGNIVVLLQSGTASENLRQPELANSALHMSNLSL